MNWLLLYNVLEWGIRIVMVPVILKRRLRPSVATAWLAVIFLFPPVGLILYLLLGHTYLGKRRVRLHRMAVKEMRTEDRRMWQRSHRTKPKVDPSLQGLIRQTEDVGGMPVLNGNHVELLQDTDATIANLIADIDAAKQHVHLLYYIYANDGTGQRVAEAVARAAQRGVTCRLLFDAVGSRPLFSDKQLVTYLISYGVQVHAVMPVRVLRRRLSRIDLRNHRKLAVIDGKVAYAGSQNIVNADYGHKRAGSWIDMTGRFTGPVVGQLQTVFLEDWLFTTGENLENADVFAALAPAGDVVAQAVPSGPDEDTTIFLRVLLAGINAAQKKIIITTPYLILDEPTLIAMSMAVSRGVEVILVVPTKSDHRLVMLAGHAFYDELLEAGIQIYQYRKGLLHAKTMTVDDSFALLGSSNFDLRSFYLNFELSVMMYGPDITAQLRFAQMTYINDSDRLTLDDWRKRPALDHYLSSAASLFSPLL